MQKLVFIEGISGIGKSTMVKALRSELESRNISVKVWLEGDHANPIDFYATAYFTSGAYDALCADFAADIETIRANTIPVGEAYLVRYSSEAAPLFQEPLLSVLRAHELSYKPQLAIPMETAMDVYARRWQAYAADPDDADLVIFDGSLLHHRINDLMNNYNITALQAIDCVKTLLASLGALPRQIFYLQTADPALQLTRARKSRGQKPLTESQMAFWRRRYAYDRQVLAALAEPVWVLDVSEGWKQAQEVILREMLSGA